MTNTKTEHAASAAAISLIAFCGSVACLIPPLNSQFIETPLLVLAVSLALHLVFVGILAKTLGKSPGRYVALAVATLPIGSIVALVLLEWHSKSYGKDQSQSAA